MFPAVNVFTAAATWFLVSEKGTDMNEFTWQISAWPKETVVLQQQ